MHHLDQQQQNLINKSNPDSMEKFLRSSAEQKGQQRTLITTHFILYLHVTSTIHKLSTDMVKCIDYQARFSSE